MATMEHKQHGKKWTECVMCGDMVRKGEGGMKCISCQNVVCEACIVEDDVCPYCMPHSLEDY